MCTAPCRFGALDGCGFQAGPLTKPVPGAACAIRSSTTSDVGDLGYCLQLCDVDADCLASGFGCDRTDAGIWGHGVCFPRSPDGG
jgi:hypothetical protein